MAQIICFGDSITFGHSDPDGGWVQRLSRYLENIYIDKHGNRMHPVCNLGISGDTVDGVLKRFENEIEPRKFGKEPVVIIALGTNDSMYTLDGDNYCEVDEFVERYRELITLAKKHTDKLIILGLLPCQDEKMQPMPWSSSGKSYSTKRLGVFNDAARELAEKEDVFFEDMFADILKRDDLETYLHDGIHPTPVGHQYIADRIKKKVAELANGFDAAE